MHQQLTYGMIEKKCWKCIFFVGKTDLFVITCTHLAGLTANIIQIMKELPFGKWLQYGYYCDKMHELVCR